MEDIEQLTRIILPKDPNQVWFRVFLIITAAFTITVLYNRYELYDYGEGFEQNESFVLKRNQDIYDPFYLELYDKLHLPENQISILDSVVKMTMPSKKSVFLDVGTGTGVYANSLKTAGYVVYGIDKSLYMVDYCSQKYPNLMVKHGDIMVPLTYERNTFSHILCTHFTIYQIENKRAFFENCYFWMIAGGCLILHLVDRDKFDPIIPAGKPVGVDTPQKYAKKRITDTHIDFLDFQYKAVYDFSNSKEAVFRESFTDTQTKHVRQNELVLYMEDANTILGIAQRCGFIVHGQVNMSDIGDEHQFIFVLQRTL